MNPIGTIEMEAKSMRFRRVGLVISAAFLASIAVSGCGKKDEQAKKPSTQVIAKVDSEEISVHQLNAVLSKASGVSQENVGQAKWDILGTLIDQQLAVNQAIEKRLDRKPEILTAVERAKREILSRAYLQEIAAAQTKPTSEEVRNYFAAHPELFEQRRIFKLQEISLQKNDAGLPTLRDKVSTSKSLEEIVGWLKSNNIAFKAGGGVRSAEQLPMEILPRVHALKDGQIALIESAEGAVIIRVAGSEKQPVTETQAAPQIQAFLSNQRSSEAVKREMKALREKAKIEYFGEFSGGVPPKPAVPPPPPSQAGGTPKACGATAQAGWSSGCRQQAN
jgi:EpsD family peptidyl-prolyl cis-trans isomerase